MTITFSTNLSSECTTPNLPRPSRLRLLGQLRPYTQNHLAQHSSGGHRRYRKSSSPTVGLSLLLDCGSEVETTPDQSRRRSEPVAPAQSSRELHQCTEGDRLPTSIRVPKLSAGSLAASYTSELPSRSSSLAPSHLTPSNDSDTRLSEEMAKHRTASTTDAHDNSEPSRAPRHEIGPPEPASHVEMKQAGTSEALNPSDSGAQSSPIRSEPSKSRQKATIRFYAYQDPHQNSRPSLQFTPMTRILPDNSSIIRVGRYSEREGIPVPNPAEPSDAAVGFKSKVVSRKHCEFSFANGQWYLRDVGSSSGTFLNHIRLSQPNMVSRLYPVRDGDIVQLGIDFRGGEEMIFRCVRIRIECNRSWQQRPNEFKLVDLCVAYVWF
jgi:hypothetical protein